MYEFSVEDSPYREHGMSDKVEQAREWIKKEDSKRELGYFEKECDEYPGDERAFMFAWVDEFGGL